jgi:hypothetical protein
MKTYWGVEVCPHEFLTSALDGDEWPVSRFCCFTRSERDHGTRLTGGQVGTRAGPGACILVFILTELHKILLHSLILESAFKSSLTF